MAVVTVENLNFTYADSDTAALSDINFSVESGEFVLVCGQSGCGKSTLVRLMKRQLAPRGKMCGRIEFCGEDVANINERAAAMEIGYVMQNPENQIVTDKVWHELAFGLECLGERSDAIKRRVAEISGYFGITDWYHKRTALLSGGQKQLLNLASIMVTNPKLLILDEPTAQLDPIAADSFIRTLKKLNTDFSLTVILVEHRLEDVFSLADKVLVLDGGRQVAFDSPQNTGLKLVSTSEPMRIALGLPSPVRLHNALKARGKCPLTVREGKHFLTENYKNDVVALNEKSDDPHQKAVAAELKNVTFRYEKNGRDILFDMSLKIYEGEHMCVLGANGAGKTTALHILAGLKKPQGGSVKLFGKKIEKYGASLYRGNIAYLAQNPQTVFACESVREELEEVCKIMGCDRNETHRRVIEIVQKLELEKVFVSHPYDLSGGEQQKAAIAKLLLFNPRIVLLDEPSKGLDTYAKTVLADIIDRLKADGKTIVTVTHDVEFAASSADRCAMYFDGQVVSVDTPVRFFSDNNFYTTAASRMSRHMYNGAVTLEKLVRLCERNGRREA